MPDRSAPDRKDKSRLIAVGAIAGAHGVRGDVRVKSFTDDPEALFTYGPLFGADGAVLLEPVRARPAKDHYIVTPKTPLQKEVWDELKGTRLHVSREALPEAEAGEFYIQDLLGLNVIAPDGTPIGLVKAVLDHGAGDLIEILPKDGGASVFVPFTEVDVPDLDLDAKTVTVATYELWSGDDSSEDEAASG